MRAGRFTRTVLPVLILVFVWVACPPRARASAADALAITANIHARHLPFGTVLDPIFASSTSEQIVGYTRCGDSALWTGHYMAAEAFRYSVTRSPDALANIRTAIAGIQSLVDVTGSGLLARCLVPIQSPYAVGIQSEEAHNGIYTNSSAGYVWVGNTSRDEYVGVVFGLGVAYDLVDDAAVQSSIAQLLTRLIDFLTGHGWAVVMPDGSISTVFLGRPDQMLTFLQIGRHVNPSRYSNAYDQQKPLLATAMLLPIGLDTAGDDHYFKFNLVYINLYNLIRLDGTTKTAAYSQAYALIRDHTAAHQNAFFNLIDFALKGPDVARDAETLALLGAWLQRSRRDRATDLHGSVPVCGDQACQPIPVPWRVPTDFLWQRSPFQLAVDGKALIESAGIDYILPYWMARYYSVTASLTVQSAASATVTLAPGSIASIYGTHPAGARLTVRDSAGTNRTATTIFDSPGQINFIMPDGVSPGLATFTVSGASGASVNAPGTVLSVAPVLFSVNGTGTGVAAATAIRTQASAPGLQSPVQVFSCSASTCTGTPIDVGLDTPVFLSLYGTGIRNRSSLANVTVTIDGVSVPVLYAGIQPDFAGLDQVNVALTLNLRGGGEANVVLAADGQVSNTVTINLQ